MPNPLTNTQKIQSLVAGIPELSGTWANAIENQDEKTISDAFNATVKYFFPNSGNLNCENVLKLIKSKKLPCKKETDSFYGIKVIAKILKSLSGNLSFGEKELLLRYDPLGPEEVVTTCYYFIYVTKTLDGFSYRLNEENHEIESWLDDKLLSEGDLINICKATDTEAIEAYASWTIAFSVENLGNPEGQTYTLFVSHDYVFYYVEESDGTRSGYQIRPETAFVNSSLTMDKNSFWKITEGSWNKAWILEHFDWKDFVIEWCARTAFVNSGLTLDKNSSRKIMEGSWNKVRILEHFGWLDLGIKWCTSDEDAES